MSRLLPLAVLAFALVWSSSAAAFSGSGVSALLRPAGITMVSVASHTIGSGTKSHSCQATDNKKTAKKSALVGSARHTGVVACEQPPRSEVVIPSLNQAAANSITALG